MRSDTLTAAERLWARVKNCFEGAALSTGCTVEYTPINAYADVRSSMPICREFVAALGGPDHVSLDDPADFLAGSTDMGNVTYECPGFHGAYGIDVENGYGNHTRQFAAAAGTGKSLASTVEWAKGMAIVGWKVLSDDAFNDAVQKDWQEDLQRAKQ